MTIGTPQPHRGGYALVEWAIIAILICVLAAAAFWLSGYHIAQHPTPDQLYGCTIAQQAANGDCP